MPRRAGRVGFLKRTRKQRKTRGRKKEQARTRRLKTERAS